MTRIATATALAAALIVPAAAGAQTGFQVVDRDSDTARFTLVGVNNRAGTAARVTISASRGMRVRVSGRVSCDNADFTHRVSRDLRVMRRTISPGRSLRFSIGATFAGAHTCFFSVDASGGRGTLRAVLRALPRPSD